LLYSVERHPKRERESIVLLKNSQKGTLEDKNSKERERERERERDRERNIAK
jgi:hypothetical protein